MPHQVTISLIWIGIAGFLLLLLSRFASHFLAHRAIRIKFLRSERITTKIRRFDGFLDLGSIKRGITRTGYVVHLQSNNGPKKEMFCLVHRLPIIGFVYDVEIWEDDKPDPR